MISKQIILGSALLIGGAVTIFAMTQNHTTTATSDQAQASAKQSEVARPVAVPLTTDVATEEKILAQKQKEREAYNQQMAKQADALLTEQERARTLALDKAEREADPDGAQISSDNASRSELIAVPAVQTRPEAVEAARAAEERKLAEQKAAEERALTEQKAKTAQPTQETKKETPKPQPKPEKTVVQAKPSEPAKNQKTTGHTVASGDTLTALSHRYGVPIAEIAAANGMNRNDSLQLGRTIRIPTGGKVAKPAQKAPAKKAEEKPAKAQDNKSEKKSSANNSGYNYSVQVALSPDKDKVDDVIKKYRAAGYKVSTSQTSRGTRVLIGSAKSYDEANAIKQKLAKDSRVDAGGAWVKKMEK